MDINALKHIAYGLYIISVQSEDQPNGFISNTVMQIASSPKFFSISCNKTNYSAELIEQNKHFCINILPQDVDPELIGNFGFYSGKTHEKFKSVNYKKGLTGAPVLYTGSMAYIECTLKEKIDAGSHFLFIGELKDSGILEKEATPLTYHYYKEVIKGEVPKTAPTYLDTEEENQQTSQGEQYKCLVCGYIYDSITGDPSQNIPPGTSFDDLPEDWRCPLCGASKIDFELKSKN